MFCLVPCFAKYKQKSSTFLEILVFHCNLLINFSSLPFSLYLHSLYSKPLNFVPLRLCVHSLCVCLFVSLSVYMFFFVSHTLFQSPLLPLSYFLLSSLASQRICRTFSFGVKTIMMIFFSNLLRALLDMNTYFFFKNRKKKKKKKKGGQNKSDTSRKRKDLRADKNLQYQYFDRKVYLTATTVRQGH